MIRNKYTLSLIMRQTGRRRSDRGEKGDSLADSSPVGYNARTLTDLRFDVR